MTGSQESAGVDAANGRSDVCAICGREDVLTRHHLIPRTRHHNKRNKRLFAREQVRTTVGLCQPCHAQIHALFTEKQLEREFNTLDALTATPAMRTFIEWIREKPPGFKLQTRKDRRRPL